MLSLKDVYKQSYAPEVYTPPEPKTDLHVPPKAYYDTALRLAIMIKESGFEFDQILCPARGGVPLADFLSRVFKKPVAILVTSSYDDASCKRTKIKISEHIAMIDNTLGKKVLLVDDMSDSGATFEALLPHLQAKYPDTEFRTAVLWVKNGSSFIPNHYVQIVGKHTWIHQYFEEFSPETLKNAMAKKNAQAIWAPSAMAKL